MTREKAIQASTILYELNSLEDQRDTIKIELEEDDGIREQFIEQILKVFNDRIKSLEQQLESL